MSLEDNIKRYAASFYEDVKEIRRHIHQHPELSFYENDTADYVAARLDEYAIPYQRMAGTGIVALLHGNNPDSKVIALRSDLDALPILEKNDVSYKSTVEGVMHACGHDVHTACLLGAARILGKLRHEFNGTVKFIFQPGEELLPGGASIMIKEGVLDNPRPHSIIGQHVLTELPVGKVGFRPGMYMASTDEIYVTVKGKGGHGAMPHQNVDPILISAHLIVALQQVVSRWSNPAMPTVLSFGKLNAAGATNIIPDKVEMEGTFRTYNEEWRLEAHARMKEMAVTLCKSMGAEVDFDIHSGYPFLKNDEHLTLRLQEAATHYMGKENVEHLALRPTAEDFAWYTHQVPGCFYRLGTGNKARGITAPVHSPHFNIDEEALIPGMGLMAYLAVSELHA